MNKSKWPTQLEIAKSSQNWYMKSMSFFYAAEILYDARENAPDNHDTVGKSLDDPEVANIFHDAIKARSTGVPIQVLLGYAIEIMLKAIFIKRHPDNIKEGKIPNEINTHDLIKLSEICEISLSEKERVLLEMLKNTIIWGRYPAKKDIRNEIVEMNIVSPHTGRCPSDTFQRIKPIFNRIESVYHIAEKISNE